MHETKFWVNDIAALVTDFNFIPTKNLTMNEKLNALTRFIIIFSLILYFADQPYWLMFLLFAVIGVLVIYLLHRNDKTEDFSIPPTYTKGSLPMATVAPLRSEEWQIPPPIYDEYTHAPKNNCGDYTRDEPIFGQYTAVNDLLPHETKAITNQSLSDAKLFMNDSFTNDTLAFRNDMSRNYINQINRTYRNGCYDSITPYNSY